MESNNFWAFFIIALIAGASIALVVSNSMTGYFAFPGFGQQQIATTPAPVTPTVPATPAAMPATPVNVPDAITMLKNSVVIQVYPIVSLSCNDVCTRRNGTCVDAEVETTTLKNLHPVECSYNISNVQDAYCRCVFTTGKGKPEVTPDGDYVYNEIKAYAIKEYGSLQNVPANVMIYRPSTQGKSIPSNVGSYIIPNGKAHDPRVLTTNGLSDCSRTLMDNAIWHSIGGLWGMERYV